MNIWIPTKLYFALPFLSVGSGIAAIISCGFDKIIPFALAMVVYGVAVLTMRVRG